MDGLSAPQGANVSEDALSVGAFQAAPAPVFALLDEAARRYAARPAIDFFGRRWNWGEIAALTDRAAAGLQKLGVAKEVRVGLCLPNTPYFVVMYYAILKAGGTVVNFNPLYTEREIEAQAKNAGVTMMVSIDLAVIHDKISRIAARGLFKRVIICSMTRILPPLKALGYRLFKRREQALVAVQNPYVKFEALIAGAARPGPVEIDPARDIAVLQFTGGTTGTPKAAMLSHANLSVNVQQILHVNPDMTPGSERIFGILPFFHVFAMTSVMNVGVALGAELILLPRLDNKLLMRTIFRRRPSIMPGVPTLFAAIAKAAEESGKTDLGFIKHCISGGAPMTAEGALRFEGISGCLILEGYGLSETSPVVSMSRPGRIRRGAVGQALPGTVVEIRDPENPERRLAQGERGEICVRGPQVMLGYDQNQAETVQSFVQGALRTGDIGYLDEDGFLFIVDRIKDLIICSGFNVYPRAIEEAACRHQAVCEAVAIGVADAYRGQAPKLFVTLREGQAATGAQIKDYLREHLSKIEMPKEVEIRDSLPKTSVGKLSRKELVAEEIAKSHLGNALQAAHT